MIPPEIKVTSETFWGSALVISVIDVGFVLLLAWRIKPTRFRQLTWAFVLSSSTRAWA